MYSTDLALAKSFFVGHLGAFIKKTMRVKQHDIVLTSRGSNHHNSTDFLESTIFWYLIHSWWSDRRGVARITVFRPSEMLLSQQSYGFFSISL